VNYYNLPRFHGISPTNVDMINGKLLGGDWNHGILNDFPETVGNFMIPTDELIFFRGVGIPPTRNGM